jgi:hypothetical protein
MLKRTALIGCLLLVIGVLALDVSTAGADCSNSSCRADVGMWGSAIPSPINPGKKSYSLLYFYAKDNGPNSAYGLDVHITVPRALKIVYARDYSAAQKCKVKGTFVSCYLGNFRREQLATVVIKAHPRGKLGTYEIPGHVYSKGVDDPNPGNNQVTVTLAVYKKGHGG